MVRWLSHIRGRPCIALLSILLVLALVGQGYSGNVILFIGDGMGVAQISAARIASVGPDGRLAMDLLPESCLMTTHSADALTTDSAAAATAFATGHKTNNGYLSVAPDGGPLKTILEHAQSLGMSTGLVTTSRLSHATPAAFASHIPDRSQEDRIAAQMLATQSTVMLGGGGDLFRNLIAAAQDSGYVYVSTADELALVDARSTDYLLGLFSADHMSYEYDRSDTDEPSLWEMTAKAIDLLDGDPDGFFLMVEGGRIDHAGHSRDGTRNIWETIAFDQAVRIGVDYALSDGNTLLIVLADHETGGMSVAEGMYHGFPTLPDRDGEASHMKGVKAAHLLGVGWTTGGHTGIPVLVMSMGPGSERMRRLIDNTDVFPIMMETLRTPVPTK